MGELVRSVVFGNLQEAEKTSKPEVGISERFKEVLQNIYLTRIDVILPSGVNIRARLSQYYSFLRQGYYPVFHEGGPKRSSGRSLADVPYVGGRPIIHIIMPENSSRVDQAVQKDIHIQRGYNPKVHIPGRQKQNPQRPVS